LRLTACSILTRCTERARIRSAGSSKAIRRPVGNFSLRSSLTARSWLRLKKSSTLPLLTLTLCIFHPPKLQHFFVETSGERLIVFKLDGLGRSHEMAMVIGVAVVVSQNTAIVFPTNPGVDVCKAILHHLAIRGLPHFLFQL